MFELQRVPGRTAYANDKEYLFFSGYAYLGQSGHSHYLEAFSQQVMQYGLLFPSARISNTPLALFEQAEQVLSEITGMEESIVFVSGFAAGQAAITLTKSANSILFQSPACHPAIAVHPPNTTNFETWVDHTIAAIELLPDAVLPILLSDTVNPLSATIYDFSFLEKINRPIRVILDDSHGFGLLGENGEGISAILPRKQNIEYVITYSLSKACHVQAGAISFSNKALAAAVRNTATYATSTPPTPAMLSTWLTQRSWLQEQRIYLRKLVTYAATLAAQWNDLIINPCLPIIVLPEKLDGQFFADQHIIISSFAYPNPEGKKINRAVINALHQKEDIDQLFAAIAVGLNR